MKHTDSEEIKLSTTIRLPFNQFEAVDLSLDLPLRPGLIKSGPHGLFIVLQTSCETAYLCCVAGESLLEPLIKACRGMLVKKAPKAPRQFISRVEFSIMRSQLLQLFLLLLSEAFMGKITPPGDLSWSRKHIVDEGGLGSRHQPCR
jgi:hypothetical protein